MKSVQPNKSPRERREALLAEKRASSCTSGLPCSEFAVERWECDYCGKAAPCIVEIHFTRTPHPHVEAQSRFRKRTCVCGESHVTDWKQIPNATSERTETRSERTT